MFMLTFTNDTVCPATRVFALHQPHDPDGEKTTFWAQVDGVKRRLDPKTVKNVERDWQ